MNVRSAVVVLLSCLVACGVADPGGGYGSGSCTASTCAGCCLNGACQPGNTAAACGKGATSCSSCNANQVCKTDQTCGVDPESTWRVQATTASIAANNNGAAWDPDNSAPDISVWTWCPETAATSSKTPESQSYSPTWTSGGCTAKAKELASVGLAFQVWDIDTFSDDSVTGRTPLVLTEANFAAGVVNIGATGGLQSMALQLQKQ